jgi:hypothetical protein
MELAQRLRPLEEFLSEPSLTVACVLLIGVSIAWVVIARLISRKLRKAERAAGTANPGTYQSPKDIWVEPPP